MRGQAPRSGAINKTAWGPRSLGTRTDPITSVVILEQGVAVGSFSKYRDKACTSLPIFFSSYPDRYGGAITAALYLDEFVGVKPSNRDTADGGEAAKVPRVPWIHMDFMAFNQGSKPGRPEGGEAQGMRALFALIDSMFGAK